VFCPLVIVNTLRINLVFNVDLSGAGALKFPDRSNHMGRIAKPSSAVDHQRNIDLSLIHISEPTRPLYISYAVFC